MGIETFGGISCLGGAEVLLKAFPPTLAGLERLRGRRDGFSLEEGEKFPDVLWRRLGSDVTVDGCSDTCSSGSLLLLLGDFKDGLV